MGPGTGPTGDGVVSSLADPAAVDERPAADPSPPTARRRRPARRRRSVLCVGGFLFGYIAVKEAVTVMAKKRARPGDEGANGGSRPMPSAAMPVVPTGPAAGPARPVIEGIRPRVDFGRFPAKASLGELVMVEADVFADGHDLLQCDLRFRGVGDRRWTTVAMEPGVNDRWRAAFPVDRVGEHEFEISASVDEFGTWRRDVDAKAGAGVDVGVDLLVGAELLRSTVGRAKGAERRELEAAAETLETMVGRSGPDGRSGAVRSGAVWPGDFPGPELAAVVRRNRSKDSAVHSAGCPVTVEPERARFGSWYELFPRSASPDATRPGTLADVVARLPYLERLGIDVLYLPPIHPIGVTNRKGANGTPAAGPDDPGSPWAIGDTERRPHRRSTRPSARWTTSTAWCAAAGDVGIERRPRPRLPVLARPSLGAPSTRGGSGTGPTAPSGIAENPPKRYEDIYPLDFEGEDWQGAVGGAARRGPVLDRARRPVFRVDNPHTKPLRVLGVADRLGEGRARPTSCSWPRPSPGPGSWSAWPRWASPSPTPTSPGATTKWELEAYLNELVHADRGRLLPAQLLAQHPRHPARGAAGRAAPRPSWTAWSWRPPWRPTTASTVRPSSCKSTWPASRGARSTPTPRSTPSATGTSTGPDSLADLVARLNSIRRQHPALQRNDTLRFHPVDNERLLAYSKSDLLEDRRWSARSPPSRSTIRT